MTIKQIKKQLEKAEKELKEKQCDVDNYKLMLLKKDLKKAMKKFSKFETFVLGELSIMKQVVDICYKK